MENASELFKRFEASADEDLFRRLNERVLSERDHLLEILVLLGVLDARRSALPKAYSSLFVCCIKHLGYCERTAYRRIAAARVGRRIPAALDRLSKGKVHLSAVVLLSEHLTEQNAQSLLS